MAGIYTVFAVDNADRLTLASQKGELLNIIVGFISCPKLSRRTPAGDVTPEDPCAYEAFDFLRAKIIGKQVKFEEEFHVDALNRAGGRVTMQDGTDVGLELVKAGFAQVSERLPPKMTKELHATYLAAQTTAKQSKLGIWSPKAKARVVRPFPCPEGFIDKLQRETAKEPVKVLIEKVLSGSLVSVLLINNPTQQISVSLSGIICPSAIQRDPKTGQPNPIGIAAKTHTERFLLHRHVLMRFEGIDPQNNNALGSVISPKGTFQEELLKRGFARTLTATIVQSGAREALVAAEKAAQEGKLGLWENFEPTTVQAGGETQDQQAAALVSGETDFQGTICQVISGDTLVVRSVDLANNNEIKYHRLQLHGVRAPRTIKRADGSDPSTRGSETRLSYEEYTWESREFMRTKYVGQGVNVHIEAVVPSQEPGREPRRTASMKDLQGNSVGAALIAAGLARVMVTRNELPPNDMDALVVAEAEARAKKIGVHSGSPSAITHVTEVNRVGDKKGKQYLGFLHRGKVGNRPPVLSGVVDMVLSGSAFRVYIPREHIIITIKLAGVSSPVGPGPNGEAADAFHVESKDFAIQQLQQREVDVSVDTSDKTGSFIGYVTPKATGKQFGPTIVAAGLAAPLGADRTSIAADLEAAGKKAQDEKLGIWSRVGALPARVARRSAQAVSNSTTFTTVAGHPWIPIRVTEVVNNASVYVFAETEENLQNRDAIATLLEDVAALKQEERRGLTAPKRGDIVACYFKEDKSWNRAKILAVFEKDYEVQYIDFGNKGEPAHRDVRPIPNEPDFEPLRTLPPLAEQVSLAYIRPLRPESEWMTSAVDKIWEFSEGSEKLYGRVEYFVGAPGSSTTTAAGAAVASSSASSEKEHRYVTVSHGTNYVTTLQEAILREGISQIEASTMNEGKRAVGSNGDYYFKILQDSQNFALKSHRGMFEYGDALSDDEDDY